VLISIYIYRFIISVPELFGLIWASTLLLFLLQFNMLLLCSGPFHCSLQLIIIFLKYPCFPPLKDDAQFVCC
jgi:hypothetical protein